MEYIVNLICNMVVGIASASVAFLMSHVLVLVAIVALLFGVWRVTRRLA